MPGTQSAADDVVDQSAQDGTKGSLLGSVRTWAKSRRDQARLEANTRRALALNKLHKGETVFVVGSGPQLNRLTDDEIRGLNAHICIGLNRVQYLVKTRYFISAYPAEVMLAARRLESSTVVHMRPEYAAPLIDGTLAVRRRTYEMGERIPGRFKVPEPTLLTRRNVALGATHLALILGAKRVVFVGVEQRTAVHFYDERPDLREQMLADLSAVPDRHLFNADHPIVTYDYLVETLRRDPQQLRASAFYKDDHTETFRRYFKQLGKRGVEVFATTKESVVSDAGASLMSLEDALSSDG